MAKVEALRNAAFVGMMTNLYHCNSFRPEHDVSFFLNLLATSSYSLTT